MKVIYLTDGTECLVDDGDYEWLNRFKWHRCTNSSGTTTYARRSYYSYTITRMHALILRPPLGFITDHADGNGLNNQRCNLRLVTPGQSNANIRKMQRTGSSEYKGVSWHKAARKWVAYINYNYRRIHLGVFDTEVDAALAYDAEARKLYGEFARTNFTEQAV